MIDRKCTVNFALYFVLFSFLNVSLLIGQMNQQEIDIRIPNDKTSSFKPECISLGRKVLSREPSQSLKDIPELISCLDREYDPVKGAAKNALLYIGKPAIPALIAALKDPKNYEDRSQKSGDAAAYSKLLEKMSSEQEIKERREYEKKAPKSLVNGSLQTLDLMNDDARGAVPELINLLKDSTIPNSTKKDIAKLIGKFGDVDFMIRIVEGKEPNINPSLGVACISGAEPSLAQKTAPVLPILIEMLKNPSDAVTVMSVLGKMGPLASPSIPELEKLSKQGDMIALVAGMTLKEIGTEEAQKAAKSYEVRSKFIESPKVYFGVYSYYAIIFGVLLGIIPVCGFIYRRNSWPYFILLALSSLVWIIYSAWNQMFYFFGNRSSIDLGFLYVVILISTPLGIISSILGFIFPRKPKIQTQSQAVKN